MNGNLNSCIFMNTYDHMSCMNMPYGGHMLDTGGICSNYVPNCTASCPAYKNFQQYYEPCLEKYYNKYAVNNKENYVVKVKTVSFREIED